MSHRWMVVRIGSLITERRHASLVYCLELAGEDDPFAAFEATAAGNGYRKSTRLNSSHIQKSRMPSSA